jgi:hypothetical protein
MDLVGDSQCCGARRIPPQGNRVTAMLKDVEHMRATNDGTIEKLVLLAKQNLQPLYV